MSTQPPEMINSCAAMGILDVGFSFALIMTASTACAPGVRAAPGVRVYKLDNLSSSSRS